MTTQVLEKNNKEWLEFISFIERGMGASDPKVLEIKRDNITNKKTESVAAFYRNKLRTRATFSKDSSLKQLLKNSNFTSEVLGQSIEDMKTWTEIHSNADWTIRTYNNAQDNIYIKCNPVDENNVIIESSNNNIDKVDSTSLEVLKEVNSILSPNNIVANVGLQIVVGIIFLALAYLVGHLLFVTYPKKVIASRIMPKNV